MKGASLSAAKERCFRPLRLLGEATAGANWRVVELALGLRWTVARRSAPAAADRRLRASAPRKRSRRTLVQRGPGEIEGGPAGTRTAERGWSLGWASVSSKRSRQAAPPSSRPPSGTRSALRAGCRLGTKVSLRVPFGFGAHRRARELVVQVRRERPAAADMRGEAVGSFEVSKDAISSRVACVQGGPRTVTPTGGATPAASPQRSREGHRGERAPQVLRTLRCGSQQGNEKAGSRRLTLGEPLGFAGPPAAAVACAPAAVFVFGQAPLT